MRSGAAPNFRITFSPGRTAHKVGRDLLGKVSASGWRPLRNSYWVNNDANLAEQDTKGLLIELVLRPTCVLPSPFAAKGVAPGGRRQNRQIQQDCQLGVPPGKKL